MKTQDGKFVLFLDLLEFAAWLDATSFSRVIRVLQCHHTYIPSYRNFKGTNQFELLHAMESAHLQRGFSEIAQNLTTFPDGTVAVCRSFDTIPAGIKGANKNGMCIENLGNFDAGQDVMNSAHRDCIISVYALLCKKFKLQPGTNTMVAHHWFDLTTGQRTDGAGTTKSCPGTSFFGGNLVNDFQSNFIPLVAERLAGYSGPVSSAPAPALYTADVKVDVVNARATPSTSGAIVKQLNRGVEVSVFEERAGWCRIDRDSSLWVNGQFLAATASPINVQAQYAAQVTASLLNVRKSPTLSADIADQLSRGASVYVYEERDGWSRIDPSNSLWVSSSYLSRVYSAVA